MTELPFCPAAGCGRRIETIGARYCRNCRCEWCGGDASNGVVITQGRKACNESCKNHLLAVKGDFPMKRMFSATLLAFALTFTLVAPAAYAMGTVGQVGQDGTVNPCSCICWTFFGTRYCVCACAS